MLREIDHGSHHIINVSKAAGLCPIVMHLKRSTSQSSFNESGQHHAIGPSLTRTDHVKKSADHDGQFGLSPIPEREELIDRFRATVRPASTGRRTKHQIVLFVPGLFRILAVNLTGTREKEPDRVTC